MDKYYWSMVMLLPIINLAYWLKSTVHSPEAAILALCFCYLDSTVLMVLVLFSALKSIDVKAPGWVKLLVYGITSIHLLCIWICKDTPFYYSSAEVKITEYGTATTFVSGPLKITHYIYLVMAFLILTGVLIYGFVKKKNRSKRLLFYYVIMALFCMIIYAFEIILHSKYTIIPVLYTLASFMIAFSYDNIQSHDLYNLIGQKQSLTGIRGFCAFDLNRCLLGYNKQFAEMIPEIKDVYIDRIIPSDSLIEPMLYDAMDCFDSKQVYSEKIRKGDKFFQMIISSFSINYDKPDGYLVELSDITEEQNNLDVVKQYTEKLSAEVEKKTEHILSIQNSVVLGLANVVENRDDNTGGHVKRTSDVIKILMEEIRKQGTYRINASKADAIIRAAAMHDLGKISIEKEILCKPGRFTEEEYAYMKTHAAKSGEIVNIILQGVEEESFVTTAYNIARYHHERWDGKGYPEGLMGESIPVEARIMAVADVYDALVSKRCYKEAMSFTEAATVMNECMGSQFDPAMRAVFAGSREKLEMYYDFDK